VTIYVRLLTAASRRNATKLMYLQPLSLHRALLNLYIVHSPTNALFIKLLQV